MMIFIITLILIIHTNIVVSLPTWQCRVCEDVAQTWHDQFPCAGNFLNWGDPTSPDINGCHIPQFDCNWVHGQLASQCFIMVRQFESEPKLQRVIWETMMMKDNPYQTCVELGKCEAETNLPGPSLCHQAFLDPYCKFDWKCKQLARHCESQCYLCNFLVRDWPLFQEACKPEEAALPASVPLPNDKWPSPSSIFKSFLQMEIVMQHRRHMHLERAQRVMAAHEASAAQKSTSASMLQSNSARHNAQRVTAANEASAEQKATSSSMLQSNSRFIFGSSAADLIKTMKFGRNALKRPSTSEKTLLKSGFTETNKCYEYWKMFRVSLKARYFGSWKRYVHMQPNMLDRLKGQMWDANIACKCLGKCELNRFEELGLLYHCRYTAKDAALMKFIYHNSNDVEVTEE